jgi:hypothetical protein
VRIATLALAWLAEHTPTVLTVVVPGTLADQPEQARQTVLRATRRAERVSPIELCASQLGTEATDEIDAAPSCVRTEPPHRLTPELRVELGAHVRSRHSELDYDDAWA